MWLNLVALPLLARICLVVLFPFSALDKIINREEALQQARSSVLAGAAPLLLGLAIVVEIATPVCIVLGWHDRFAAFVLAGFCAVTALMYHRFWAYGDFWAKGNSQARNHFWDFLKNFGLVGGLVLLIVGGSWLPATAVLEHPLSHAPRAATPPAAPLPGESSMTTPRTTVSGGDKDTAPTVTYWHAWTDKDGLSHQTQGILTRFQQQSMGGAAPQWNDKLGPANATVLVSVQPVGWVGDWHENPKPQWIIPLSGRWWVETMDGTRVEMGPGDISFGEDQNCKADAQGNKGHKSGTVGNEPAVLMIIQLDETPTVDRPGRWT